MGKRYWLKWLKAALIRGIKTFSQTAIAGISVGAAFSEIDWLRVLSVSGVSFVLSMFTSLAGLPEVDGKQMLPEKTDPPDEPIEPVE